MIDGLLEVISEAIKKGMGKFKTGKDHSFAASGQVIKG